MSRHRSLNVLQTHRFWLMDVVPSGVFPFLVLGTPSMAFSAITSPEYTFETEEVKQVNSMFKRHVYSGGSVGPITLSRGVRGYDDTMWQWAKSAINGMDMINRHLLLIHFTPDIPGLNVADVNLFDFELPGGAFGSAKFVPAKAWILFDSIPIRYKAGSDFDATTGSASIAELDIQPWSMIEFTMIPAVFGQPMT